MILNFTNYLIANPGGNRKIAKTLETLFDILLHKEEHKNRRWSLLNPGSGSGSNVLLGQSVVNPLVWLVIFRVVQNADCHLQAETYKTTNTLLISNKYNCETLLSQQGWQSLLFVDISNSLDVTEKDNFLDKQLHKYFLNIFALLHTHAYCARDDFLEIICESMVSLYSYVKDVDSADEIARKLLQTLLSLVHHKKYQFSMGDCSARVWSHLPLLPKLISQFVFQCYNFENVIKGSGFNRVMISKQYKPNSPGTIRRSLLYNNCRCTEIGEEISKIEEFSNIEEIMDDPEKDQSHQILSTPLKMKRKRSSKAPSLEDITEIENQDTEYWKAKYLEKEQECEKLRIKLKCLESKLNNKKQSISAEDTMIVDFDEDLLYNSPNSQSPDCEPRHTLSDQPSPKQKMIKHTRTHSMPNRTPDSSLGAQIYATQKTKGDIKRARSVPTPKSDIENERGIGSKQKTYPKEQKAYYKDQTKVCHNCTHKRTSHERYAFRYKKTSNGVECLDLPLMKQIFDMYESLSLEESKCRDARRITSVEDEQFFAQQAEYFEFLRDCCDLLNHIQGIPTDRFPNSFLISIIIGNFLNAETKDKRRLVFSKEGQLVYIKSAKRISKNRNARRAAGQPQLRKSRSLGSFFLQDKDN